MMAWTGVARRRARLVASWSARIVGGGALGLALAAACNVEPGATPQFAPHCGDDGGDATCVIAHPGQPFCSLCVPVAQDEGCVSSMPVAACRPGGGGPGPGDDGITDGGDMSTTTGGAATDEDSTSSDGGDTLAVDETASSGDDTAGVTLCGAEGTLDPECEAVDASRPFCVGGVCTSCDDAGGDDFCGGIDGATPACDAKLGACVACSAATPGACGGLTPVCDTSVGVCMPCTEHDECPGSACHASPDDPRYGACFSSDAVVWVDETNPCPGTGAQDDAFCNLPEVVDAIEADEEVVIFLVGGDPYGDDLEIFVPADVAIVGVGSPSVTGHPFSSQSTIRLTDGARLYLSNIRINGNSNYNGIECDESLVSMADVEVGDNGRWGVLVSSPCTVELRRTMVYGNESGGIRMLGGSLTTDNSAIGENGNGLTGPGVRLLFAEFSALYTTIAGNDAFDADSVQCDGDVSGEIRNSIINGTQLQSIDIDCFSLSFEYNAMSSSAFANGTNANIDEYVAAYFTDPSDGDFRIAAPPLTPFGDVAQWVEGDPRFDADGTERPADALGFVGVDEP